MTKIRNLKKTLLSDNWYTLNKFRFDIQDKYGEWESIEREAYDRGNGATILLYNKANNTVVLTKQFRLPTYVNGNEDGMLIEACAGLLDKDNAEDCIRKETEEETGYRITKVEKVYEVYMSPGSVTEILYFFTGEYTNDMKVSDGGGAENEHENITVLEMPFEEAYNMIANGGIKDAKTIMLLQHAKLNGIMDN